MTSQTGGQAVDGIGDVTPYSQGGGNQPGYYGGFAVGWGDQPASCSGGITTTYTWEADAPGDGPPTQVVVAQACQAGWLGEMGYAYGSCDNDLGDPEQDVFDADGNPSGGGSGSDAGGPLISPTITHYSQQAGGATVTVSCSPSAFVVGPVDSVDWLCWVNYSVSVSPVIVSLNGTTQDSSGGDNILIGQGCTATVSAGPATLSNFQWSVPGETFADYRVLDYSYEWDAASESTIFVPGSGTVYAVDPSEYSKPNPHWYWKKGSLYGEEMTVSCTASASVNGQSIGSVTAEKKVSVWKPYYVFSPNALGVEMNNGGFNESLLHADIQYVAGVGTPALFASSEGSGIWQTTQLCHINRLIEYFYGVPVPNSTNGLVLDANFNYTSTSNPPGPFSANSTEDQPETQLISDSPSTDLDDCIRGTMDDQFKTYLMYLPPGDPNSVKWVPLNLCEWYVRADASRSFDVFHDIWSDWTPDPPGTMAITSASLS